MKIKPSHILLAIAALFMFLLPFILPTDFSSNLRLFHSLTGGMSMFLLLYAIDFFEEEKK